MIACCMPPVFQNHKCNNIKSLEDMSCVAGIAEGNNVRISCIANEFNSVMGVMAINEEETWASGCLLACLLIEIFKPPNSHQSISPAILCDSNTRRSTTHISISDQLLAIGELNLLASYLQHWLLSNHRTSSYP